MTLGCEKIQIRNYHDSRGYSSSLHAELSHRLQILGDLKLAPCGRPQLLQPHPLCQLPQRETLPTVNIKHTLGGGGGGRGGAKGEGAGNPEVIP